MHCKRKDGTDRAWFNTREEADQFIKDPENPAYHDDVVVLCGHCGFFHCSHPTWLEFRPWERPVEELMVN